MSKYLEDKDLIPKLVTNNFKLIVVVSIVSVICISVFLFPLEVQNMLKVRYTIFNPLTYITASFVHGNVQHLGSNLLVFILSAFLLYFINKKANQMRFFFISVLMMFAVLPLLNYSLLFYFGIYKTEFGFGLSLVDSGLIGFTIPSLVLFFKARLKNFNQTLFFFSMFLFTACFIIVPYTTFFSYNFLVLVLCAILGFFAGKSEIKKILRFVVESFKQRENQMESLIMAFTLWFYFFSVAGLFPSSIVSQEGITDIVSHYIGLLFGILPFSFFIIFKIRSLAGELLEYA